MIEPSYIKVQTKYNYWQNNVLYDYVRGLTDEQRNAETSISLGSIHKTISYGCSVDSQTIDLLIENKHKDESDVCLEQLNQSWQILSKYRMELDLNLLDWSTSVSKNILTHEIYIPDQIYKNPVISIKLLIINLFTHQISIRTKVNCILSQLGLKSVENSLLEMPCLVTSRGYENCEPIIPF